MRWTLAGLVWIAACYAPAIAPGASCADNLLCPEGQTCSATRVCTIASLTDAGAGDDASEVDAAPDRDGDGVPDTTDNCPDDQNPGQQDEEGDMVGDRCDPCPQLAGGAVIDGDGDHIGDICDPNPGVADISWLFEGFRGGLPQWPGSSGWLSMGDGAQVAAAGEPAQDSEFLVLPLAGDGRASFDRYSTAVSVAIQQTGTGAFHEIGIEYYDSNTDKGLSCELAEVNGMRVLWLNDAINLDKPMPYGWMNGASYVLRLVRQGNAFSCDVSGPSGALMVMGTSAVVPRNGAGTDIWAYGATVRVGSVSVVGPPP